MKVLVSKINPKEIEEKIAKAESVTQTLYKKGSKSGNLTVPIIVFYGCLLYAGSIVINNTRKN